MTTHRRLSESSRSDQPGDDRRKDYLLRDVVRGCQNGLEAHGFRLEGRGSSGEQSWVRFQRPVQDPNGQDGTLVFLVAHGRGEQALLVDAYFVDTDLAIHSPRRKLLHRYSQDAEVPRIVREVVDTVCSWPPQAS
jgi:hypothetical protein